jgi:hypothetical protein
MVVQSLPVSKKGCCVYWIPSNDRILRNASRSALYLKYAVSDNAVEVERMYVEGRRSIRIRSRILVWQRVGRSCSFKTKQMFLHSYQKRLNSTIFRLTERPHRDGAIDEGARLNATNIGRSSMAK